jgi:hypothetical protein
VSALELLQRYLEHPALVKSIASEHGKAMRLEIVRGLPEKPARERIGLAAVAVETWSAIFIMGGAASPTITRDEIEDILGLACEAFLAARAEARLS